jgi:hypothetical protein
MAAKNIQAPASDPLPVDDSSEGGLTDPRFLSPGPDDPIAGPDGAPIPPPTPEKEPPADPVVEAGGAGLIDPRVLSPGTEGSDVP